MIFTCIFKNDSKLQDDVNSINAYIDLTIKICTQNFKQFLKNEESSFLDVSETAYPIV